ncbi:MAG: T9SS type A sorting domain-containing protein [Ferruginibacter sp.]|nr:T9SS type A sorting domain-containing protein [Ferruginibacter sp.]
MKRSTFTTLTPTHTRTWMRNLIGSVTLLIMLFFSGINVNAQSMANYTFATAENATLYDLSSGATQVMEDRQDTKATDVFPIGFDFWFMGQKYAYASANSNGQFQLHKSALETAIATTSFTTGALNTNRFAPMAGDNEVADGMRIKVFGSAPNRVFVIEWTGFYVYWTPDMTNAGNMQAWLREGSNRVDFVYGEMYNSSSTAQTRYIFLGSSNTATTLGYVTLNTPPTASTYTVAATPVSFSVPGGSGTVTGTTVIPGLGSTIEGQRRIFSFTPAAGPSGTADNISFSNVTPLTLTVNWADNATGENGFLIEYSSDGGTTWTQAGSAAANATTFNVTGLIPSTSYDFKVTPFKEIGGTSTTASQATTASPIVTSIASGLWSATTTWSSGAVPTEVDAVVIADGTTVVQDVAAAKAWTVTIGSGSGSPAVLEHNNAITARTLTVGDDFTINGNGTFRGANANPSSSTTHTLSISGDIAINGAGTFNGTTFANSKLNITFTGATDKTFTTSATSTLALSVITLNMGTGYANTMEFIPGADFTAPATGFITYTNGTFKLSGVGKIVAPSETFTSATLVPANGGFWLNNPNYVVKAKAAISYLYGFFKITDGTFNVGTTNAHYLSFTTTSKSYFAGGVTNISGRFYNTSANYTEITGGVINVATVGNVAASSGSFNITSTTADFRMSGGTINLVNPNTYSTVTSRYDVYINPTSMDNVTGGVINFGVPGTTPPGSVFDGLGYKTTNIVVKAGFTVKLRSSTNNIHGNITVEPGATLDLQTFNLIVNGNSTSPGNIICNGTITQGAVETVRVQMFGEHGQQTISGSGAFGNVSRPIAGMGVANDDGVNFTSGTLTTNRINLFNGNITGANNITLGIGGTSSTVIQISQSASTVMGGSLDASPIYNFGTGGHTVLYLEEPVSRNTGFEIPSGRALAALSIDNTKGITLVGGNLSVGSLTLTNGNINTSASNVLGFGGTNNTGSEDSYINGPVAREIPANQITGTTFTFPTGNGSGYYPFDLVDATTIGGTTTIMAEVFDGSTGGTAGTNLSALNPNRYWAASTVDGASNFNNTLIRLNDTRGVYDQIGNSSTLTGSYGLVGSLTPDLTDNSITSKAPEATSIDGYYVMGRGDAGSITNKTITPSATQCTNIARIVDVTVLPGASPVSTVEILYSVDGDNQTPISMTNGVGNDWSGTIPTVTPSNGEVVWSIKVTSTNGMNFTEDGGTYKDEPFTGVTITPTADPTTVCAGENSILEATVLDGAPGDATVGLGETTSATYPAPFYSLWSNKHEQILYPASELLAAGLAPGNITSVTFYVTSGTIANKDFTIKLKQSSITNMSVFEVGGFTTVFTVPSYQQVVGTNLITFQTPFAWDGVSSLVMDICFGDGSSSATLSSTSTADNTSYVSVIKTHFSAATAAATVCSDITSQVVTYSVRPRTTFGGIVGTYVTDDMNITWQPGNLTGSQVTVTPALTQQYTITATDPVSGCVSAATPVTVTVNPLPETPIPAGSTQCGVGVPNAFVVTNFQSPNVSTSDFYWYDAPTGGNLLQTGGSIYTGSISETTTFYVSESNGTCQSARVMVTATVNQPDAVTATVDNDEICLGASANLGMNQSGSNQTYSFSWEASPETGSGITNPTPGASGTGALMVTPTAAGTYTYTITAVDGGCTTQSTIDVVVNALPPAPVASATPAAICAGGTSNLEATVIEGQMDYKTVAPGTLTTASTGSPFYPLYGGYKNTYLYTATELSDAGLIAGPINSLGIFLSGTLTKTYQGLKIGMGTIVDNSFLTVEHPSTSTVYTAPGTFTPAAGINTFVFDVPFIWDGTSNVVVSFCYSNNDGGGGTGPTIKYSSVTNSIIYTYSDNVTPAAMCAAVSGTPGGNGGTYRSTYHPEFIFYGLTGTDVTDDMDITWQPGNLSGGSVSVSPATTQTYSLTVENPLTGCISTGSATVTVNQLPPAPTANAGNHCGELVPNASVTSNSGESTPFFKWYDAETGGNLVQSGTSTEFTQTIDQTTTWWVSEVTSAGCEGPRVELTETVIDADAITAASDLDDVCPGTAIELSATQNGFNNFYDYSWTASPEAGSGISGEVPGNPLSVTPTLPGTYTYTAKAVDLFMGCQALSDVVVTIKDVPVISSVTATPNPSCSGSPVELEAFSRIGNPTTIKVGTGTTGFSGAANPYWRGNSTQAMKVQFLYTASMLTNAGFVPGQLLTGLTFVITANTAAPPQFDNYTIALGHTSQTALTTTFVTGLTLVKSAFNHTPVIGDNTYTFDTPFTWNGTDNLVLQTTFDNNPSGACPTCYGGSVSTEYTANPGYVCASYYYDAAAPQGVRDIYNYSGAATTQSNLANVTFQSIPANNTGLYTWSWAPGGETTPVKTVSPLVTTEYTVTATDPNTGCVNSSTVEATVLALPNTPIANNSTQCGYGVPTASVSTGGSNGTYTWYDAETGGNIVQSGGSTFAGEISVTTSFWVSENDGNCESERTEVIATVNQPDAITATGPAVVCSGNSISLGVNQSGNTQNYTYTWTADPEEGSGMSGTLSGGVQTITPTEPGTYTYEVIGYDPAGPCYIRDEITVTMGLTPVVTAAAATPATICVGEESELSAESIIGNQLTAVVGAGNSSSNSSGSPFYNTSWDAGKTTYIYLASELTNAGFTAGDINNISIEVTVNQATTYGGFKVGIGNYAGSSFVSPYTSPATTTVFAPATPYATTLGLNTFEFDQPFYWDGTSNLVVQFCWGNPGSATGATVKTETISGMSIYNYADNITAADMCASTTAYSISVRPQVTFNRTHKDYTDDLDWTWTPGNLSGSTVTVSPGATTTYSVTAVDPITGCTSASQQVEVEVLAVPTIPTATPSTQCGLGVPTASVSGGAGTMMWYDAETGGTLLQTGGNTYTSEISQTTTFWVAESNGTCEGPRVAVTVTVTQPDALTATANAVVCLGSSVSLGVTQNGNNQSYTFTWTADPEAGSGITGSLTGASQSITPTAPGSYTYTVAGYDPGNGGCNAQSDVVVSVVALPDVSNVTASPDVICSGNSSTLSARSLGALVANKTVGDYSSTASNLSGAPFYGSWGGGKVSYIYKASELLGKGITAGELGGFGFDFTTGQPTIFKGFKISIGMTNNTVFSAPVTHISGGTEVYTGPLADDGVQIASSGIQVFNFDQPFYWDGVSNIFVTICWSNNNGGSNTGPSVARDYFAGQNITAYTYGDNRTPAQVCGTMTGGVLDGNNVSSGSTLGYAYRPVGIFKTLTGDVTSTRTWTWNPGNLSGSSVSVSPTVTTTYYVTATDNITGCTSLPESVEVVVTPLSGTASASQTEICIGGSTTLQANGYGGEPLSYNWRIGNTVIGNTETLLVTPTSTTTYTLTVFDACNNSVEDDITITVHPLPTAGIAEAGPINICYPATQTFNATTNAGSATYQWYRNGVAIPGATSSSYVASQSGSFTVTATNTVTGCTSNTSAAVSLTINPKPDAVIVTPSAVNMCENNPQLLTASGGLVAVPGSGVATGSSPTTTVGASSPFYRLYEGSRRQYIVLASELTGMGMVAGSELNSISFNVTALARPNDINNDNFFIKAGLTSGLLTSAYVPDASLTTVYYSPSYEPVLGANVFNFISPLVWNGTSNVVISVCFDNDPDNTCSAGSPVCWSNAATVSSATAAAGTGRYNYADNSVGVRDMCAGTNGTETVTTIRPIMTFGITLSQPTAITWSPVAGLFTDPAATVAYNGEAATSVYASPSAGNHTYTATSTSNKGCTNSGTVEVNVTPALDVSAEITGPTNSGAHVGNGSPLATYSITASNYSTIVWNIPNTALNVSGQGTTSISFNYATNYTGSISVDVTGISPCDPITRTLNITCDAPAAPVISGQVNVCTYVGTNVELTYTAAPDANATSYSWVVPPTNVTVVNGQGTGELTITLGAGFTAQANKQLRVRAHNSCGTSEMSIFYMLAQMPGSLGEISGPMDACGLIDGQTQVVYSVAEVDQAEQYNWVVPAGVTIINGQGTTSITVEFDNAFATSAISVTAQNGCGVSNTRSITISRTVPSIPSLISGPNNPCLYMPSVGYPSGQIATYSVAQVGGNTYTWTVPTGANIESGQGTNSITVSFSGSYNGGGISVTASTGCGTSGSRSIALSNRMPSAPSGIDIDIVSEDCPNRVYTYSLSSMPMQATSVVWTVPAGATIVDGQGTTSITVEYSGMSIAGNITAVGNNGCGNSGIRSLKVKFPECSQGERGESLPITKVTPVEVIEGGLDVSIFPNPSVHSFKLVAKSTDKFNKIQVRLVDNLGRTYKVMSMMPGETLTLGNELKAGSYFVEVVQGKNKASKRIIKL